MVLPANTETIQKALQALREGNCIGFPTETVYGLAGDGLNAEAVAKIFEIKRRPSFDPLILHIVQEYDLKHIASEVPKISVEVEKLKKAFWPGALTLVLPKKEIVPDLVTSGMKTVAVRCPRHEVAQKILRQFGKPLAAPSANYFGRISPTSADAVFQELGKEVSIIVDGGICEKGIESTILDCSGEEIKLLRPGAIEKEKIEEVLGQKIKRELSNNAQAPGMLKNHYAPRTPFYLSSKPLNFLEKYPERYGYLFWGEVSRLALKTSKTLSEANNLQEAAATLFQKMRELDESKYEAIVSDRVPEEGLGLAILDRLKKASSGEVLWNEEKKAFEISV